MGSRSHDGRWDQNWEIADHVLVSFWHGLCGLLGDCFSAFPLTAILAQVQVKHAACMSAYENIV